MTDDKKQNAMGGHAMNKTILCLIPLAVAVNIISIAYAIKYFFDVELQYLPPLTLTICFFQALAITAYNVFRE